jgi:outer membrane immunogenic protein
MKKLLGSVAVCVGAMLVSNAFAADVTPSPIQQAPLRMGPPPFSWTGIYIGGNAGYGFADATVNESAFGFSATATERLTGAIAGGQIGFNWQFGSFLAGLEADLQWSGQKFTVTAPGITATDKITSFGTLRPRIGFVADHWLFYGTAGLGYGMWRTDITTPFVTAWASTSRLTWAAGAGVEAAVTNNVTVKLEYLFLDTGNISQTVGGATASATVTDSLLRVGVNFLAPVGR